MGHRLRLRSGPHEIALSDFLADLAKVRVQRDPNLMAERVVKVRNPPERPREEQSGLAERSRAGEG